MYQNTIFFLLENILTTHRADYQCNCAVITSEQINSDCLPTHREETEICQIRTQEQVTSFTKRVAPSTTQLFLWIDRVNVHVQRRSPNTHREGLQIDSR